MLTNELGSTEGERKTEERKGLELNRQQEKRVKELKCFLYIQRWTKDFFLLMR